MPGWLHPIGKTANRSGIHFYINCIFSQGEAELDDQEDIIKLLPRLLEGRSSVQVRFEFSLIMGLGWATLK